VTEQLHAGAVAIGRNEGERLRRCLESIRAQGIPAVYVDSGSSDGSVTLAHELGAEILELDPSKSFSAARARNEGAARLRESVEALRWVLFIDGDCELVDGFLDAAINALSSDESCAVVFGRRTERHPNASPYNLLCDIEWDGSPGEVTACGGDALMRASAFAAVEGFDPSFIGGEEPELCVRLRAAGWRIRRIAAPMTIHDAAMTRFSQWWRRAMRGGHAYAHGASRHGAPPERFRRSELRSLVFWGAGLPLLSLLALLLTGGGLWLLLLYPIQVLRVRRSSAARALPASSAWLYAASCVGSKFPEFFGAAKFYAGLLRGRKTELIEYK
jgi:GT2 family glycosyltransferase